MRNYLSNYRKRTTFGLPLGWRDETTIGFYNSIQLISSRRISFEHLFLTSDNIFHSASVLG